MDSSEKYPDLMAYIAERSALQTSSEWCGQLRVDEQAAFDGKLAEVAAQLLQAQAEYKAQQEASGYNGYPYNSAMGKFLGLPIRSNNEPPHGYYMANSLSGWYRLGAAIREAKELLANGATLRVVLAKDKKTGKPIRFAAFSGDQVKLGQDVEANNGKRAFRLSSSWSTETCMEKVVQALRTGEPYGS